MSAEKLVPTRVIEIDASTLDIEYPKVGKRERVLPHDCNADGELKYGSISYTSYTMEHEQINIGNVKGWKCDGCELVILQPEVKDAIYDAIDEKREVLRKEETS